MICCIKKANDKLYNPNSKFRKNITKIIPVSVDIILTIENPTGFNTEDPKLIKIEFKDLNDAVTTAILKHSSIIFLYSLSSKKLFKKYDIIIPTIEIIIENRKNKSTPELKYSLNPLWFLIEKHFDILSINKVLIPKSNTSRSTITPEVAIQKPYNSTEKNFR